MFLLLHHPVLYLQHDVLKPEEVGECVDKKNLPECSSQTDITYIFRFQFFISSSDCSFLQSVEDKVDLLLIFESQLLVDNLDVSHWVDVALHMDDVLIIKSSYNMRTLASDSRL